MGGGDPKISAATRTRGAPFTGPHARPYPYPPVASLPAVPRRPHPLLLGGLLALLAGCAPALPPPPPAPPPAEAAVAALEALLATCRSGTCGFEVAHDAALDTLVLDGERLEVRFNAALGHRPFRPASRAAFEAAVLARVAPLFPGTAVTILAGDYPVGALVPNAFRAAADRDPAREAHPAPRPTALVRPLDRPWTPTAGLQGRYVALWHSHGWYYDQASDRWLWQRPRLFTTVEDLLPMAFVHAHLVPMLERAGATVLLPRERDLQPHMAIVDADAPGSGYAETGPWRDGDGPGFAPRPTYGERENPFRLGGHRVAEGGTAAEARWTPDLPEAGDYAVYVAYVAAPDRTEHALYTVHHAGGTARFLLNQRIGGGTWVYLGTFRFEAGRRGAVTLSTERAAPGETVSADAVRFGGGMGDVARGGRPSGRPRWTEGARYYLQFAGAPDSTVYSLSGYTDDYTDDFRGRGEWVNHLRGAPFGPNADPTAPGLGIPVDLSLAFHTDAGIRPDTTVGTLLIYATTALDSARTFPDGVHRLANRDLADLLQTQIVEDLRALHDPTWTRRSLWDRRYAEAVRPNVPSALVELLSHQNFLDMRFGLDPRFQHDAARAIYKGILRFLADHHGTEAVVQPLPVTHLRAEPHGADGVTLRWRPTRDPLEPSADPEAYVVYARRPGGAFDHGTLVRDTSLTLTGLAPGRVHAWRVAAVNAGGESAPSAVVAYARPEDVARGTVLIVDAFDRVAPPAVLEGGNLAGFARHLDPGVPYRYDLHTTGDQLNFDRTDTGAGDDARAHGASAADLETTVLPGNTFDFAVPLAEAALAAGFAVTTASAHAVAEGSVDLAPYDAVKLLLGAQRRTPHPHRPDAFAAWPVALRTALAGACAQGAGLVVSGAYVGTDAAGDADATAFLREVLGLRWESNHAASRGEAVAAADGPFAPGTRLRFASSPHPSVYHAPPDALAPASGTATTALRYAENDRPAAVVHAGPACRTLAFGFPLETLLTPEDRAAAMGTALGFVVPDRTTPTGRRAGP